MRWPWARDSSSQHLVLSWADETLAYVLARLNVDGSFHVVKYGVERQGADGIEGLCRRLEDLNLKGLVARVMLRPEQYQILQIEAPAVAPDELRSAARYQVREMLDMHLDDVTLDVMRVGDGLQKGVGHLFVIAASNAGIRSVSDLGEAMQWKVSVIDVQETAQRNLQNALASRENGVDGATAALMLLDRRQALLTISANEELFYTRRFDLPEGFLEAPLQRNIDSLPMSNKAPPDYRVDYDSLNSSYSGSDTSPAMLTSNVGNDDNAQRFLVEVQRSLDLWERVWSAMPIQGIRVHAGEHSEDLSVWLTAQLGQKVLPMIVGTLFSVFEGGTAADDVLCLPLLGLLLRSESKSL